MIKVAVLGYGNIGSGVVQVLLKNKETIAKKAGDEIVPACVLDLRDFPGDVMEDKVVKDINLITQNPEISIVVETMGGTKPAYAFVKACLEAGKHVATSNKELVAAHGPELLEIAKAHHVSFLFEASVGGGIPIIRPMHQCLTANNILKIAGILNGTTNYILDQMIRKGKTFETALKDAQNNGFAERNPAADIEGHDACRKIAILASLASGKMIDYNDIDTDGITNITLDDVKYAAAMDSVIKLIGYAQFDENGKVYSIVSPMVIKNSSPLAGVDGVFNAIMVTGDCVGDVMFYGKGAGKLPTASAVVGDIVDAAKHLHTNISTNWNSTPAVLKPLDDVTGRFFVRIKKDAAEEAKKVFGEIEVICLKQLPEECAFITAEMTQGEFKEKLTKIESQVLAKIRVKD